MAALGYAAAFREVGHHLIDVLAEYLETLRQRLLGACDDCGVRELASEIEIDAPQEHVWRVLTDFGAYADWDPFIRHIEGRTRFVQSETFRGVLAPLFGRALGATARGFEQMNRALKARVESAEKPL